jgi:hypothetical protein
LCVSQLARNQAWGFEKVEVRKQSGNGALQKEAIRQLF